MNGWLDALVRRRPELQECAHAVERAEEAFGTVFASGGQLLVCGNGGSAADADHIVGELMKGFRRPRPLRSDAQQALREVDAELGAELAVGLQEALPAIALVAHAALLSAIANDLDARWAYAQQVVGYGRPGDALLAISTSGNAGNVEAAVVTARARGLRTVALTGADGGRIARLCEVVVKVPERDTALVQELHQSVYHAWCGALEERLFGQDGSLSETA